MDYANESSLLSAIGRLRAIKKRRLELKKEDAAVAAQLGHASVTTTASFYTHAVAGSQKRAAGVLPGLALPRQGA